MEHRLTLQTQLRHCPFLSLVVLLERRTSKESSSRRIMRLVPVFILETYNQTNYKYWPKFVQTDNALSSIKTGGHCVKRIYHRSLRFISHKATMAKEKERLRFRICQT